MAYGNAKRMWNLQEYIIKEYDTLKASHDKLLEVLSDLREDLDEDHIHNREDCTGDCPVCLIDEAIAEAEKL